ncbi:hypothetical protein A4G19_07795 [Pasteurellaceae bacterium Macca]|nr:hypothetical protein [Pasteurellaceae bacterium Macca]
MKHTYVKLAIKLMKIKYRNMKSIILFCCMPLLSGCLFGFEAFFPESYYKCSSLSGWCIEEPTKEIMFWDIKDSSYKVTEKCCSNKWESQAKKKFQQINSIFNLCEVSAQTGDSLVGKMKSEVYSCLSQKGLYRYISKP